MQSKELSAPYPTMKSVIMEHFKKTCIIMTICLIICTCLYINIQCLICGAFKNFYVHVWR